jgi:hypothetical protein
LKIFPIICGEENKQKPRQSFQFFDHKNTTQKNSLKKQTEEQNIGETTTTHKKAQPNVTTAPCRFKYFFG